MTFETLGTIHFQRAKSGHSTGGYSRQQVGSSDEDMVRHRVQRDGFAGEKPQVSGCTS
jgi:hypothetical protein